MQIQPRLKLFVILLLCTTFLVTFAQVGTLAFSAISGDHFSEGVHIANVNLGGKTLAEGKIIIEDAAKEWEESGTIQIAYHGQQLTLGKGNYQFLITDSIQAASTTTPLIVKVEREKLLLAIQTIAPAIDENDADLDLLSSDIEAYASVLSLDQVVFDLQKYLFDDEKEKTILAVSKINNVAGIEALSNFLKETGVLTIPPASQFSLSEFFGKQKVLNVDPRQLNLIASGIYEVFLHTNFEVLERHINANLPPKERIGFDVQISPERNMDLVIYNPNEQEYLVELDIQNGILVVRLIGYPFSGKYEVSVQKQEFAPKTIIQYSPLLEPDDTKVEKEGKSGLLAIVERESFDDKGELMKTEVIFEDFYPPVHRVELHGLQSESPVELPEENAEGPVLAPVQGNVDSPTNTGSAGSSDTTGIGAENTEKTPSSPGKSTESNPNKSGNGVIWGKTDEDEK